MIRGNDVKKLLTEKEIELINLLELNWDTAVFTGSRAFGTNKPDSDLDIFFNSDIQLNKYGTLLNCLPKEWIPKPIDNFDEDYPETQLNVVSGRLNVFAVSPDYYQMYVDATKLCLNGGSKQQFKNFVDLAFDNEWYQ